MTTAEAALLVSILTAIGAFIGWFDSRRRALAIERRSAVAFHIEPVPHTPGTYFLRHVGDTVCRSVSIDESATRHQWSLSGEVYAAVMHPNMALVFRVSPIDESTPDAILVRWERPFSGARLVLMPR